MRITHAAALPLLAATTVLTAPFMATPPQGLPPGHPPTQVAPPPSTANSEDVATIDAIINAYYESISGAAGEARDWDRFRSLFFPAGHFVTTRTVGDAQVPYILSPDEFILGNRSYFEGGGYFESEIFRQVDSFGRVAHVLSTYESRRIRDDAPYSRGLNSIQLLNTGDRWWIISIMWDYERPNGDTLPSKYLGSDGNDG
jgi:hypothetical protein